MRLNPEEAEKRKMRLRGEGSEGDGDVWRRGKGPEMVSTHAIGNSELVSSLSAVFPWLASPTGIS